LRLLDYYNLKAKDTRTTWRMSVEVSKHGTVCPDLLYGTLPTLLLVRSRSHPLVTPYYCRLGDLLCFVFICVLIVCLICLVYYMFLQYFDTVGWVFWPVKTVSHISYTVLAGT